MLLLAILFLSTTTSVSSDFFNIPHPLHPPKISSDFSNIHHPLHPPHHTLSPPLSRLSSPPSCLVNTTDVTIHLGTLRGYVYTTKERENVRIFKQVPFARPPVGPLRWRMPERPRPWRGVRDATKFGHACISNTTQIRMPPSGYSEDCLFLNVYAGEQCTPFSPCPVVFYIHGGMLKLDTPVAFEDEILSTNFASRGLVLVTTAYRIGFAGILVFEDDSVVPANLAIYDMLHSLNFTKEIIGAFGGDPSQVTLYGHSSGGSQTLMFTFSPGIAKRNEPFTLFQRAVAMSPGWGFENETRQIETTRAIAAELGCSGSAAEIISCMRPLSSERILAAQHKYELADKQHHALQGVIMRAPLFPINNIREMRDNPIPIPLLTGTITHEYDSWEDDPDNIVITFAQGYRHPHAVFDKFLRDKANHRIEFNTTSTTQSMFLTTFQQAEAMAKTGAPAYLYSYDYTLSNRTSHVDDLTLVFGNRPRVLDKNERWLADFYPRLFANFAKNGRPHPDWQPLIVRPQDHNYYSVNYVRGTGIKPRMKNGYHSDLIDYWTGEMDRYDRLLTRLIGDRDYDQNGWRSVLAKVSSVSKTQPMSVAKSDATESIHRSNLFLLIASLVSVFCIGLVVRAKRRSRDEYEPLLGGVQA